MRLGRSRCARTRTRRFSSSHAGSRHRRARGLCLFVPRLTPGKPHDGRSNCQRDHASGQASQSITPRDRLPPARTGHRRARWLRWRHGLVLIGTERERGIGGGGSPAQALPAGGDCHQCLALRTANLPTLEFGCRLHGMPVRAHDSEKNRHTNLPQSFIEASRRGEICPSSSITAAVPSSCSSRR